MVRDYADIRQILLGLPGLGGGWTELVPLPSPAAGAALSHKVPNNVWERARALTFLYTASAATPGRQPVARLVSPDSITVVETPIGTQIGPSGAVTCFAYPGAPAAVGAGLSVQGDGNVTSPAAGAAIVTVTLTQGTWTISWGVRISGTVAAADNNNMQLQQGATVLLVADVPQGGSNVSSQPSVTIEVPAAGSTITVNAIAIGTVGAVYSAQISAVPGETTSAYAPLPDLLLRPGWSIQATALGIQAADQISAAQLLVDRFPSDYASGALWSNELEAEEAALASLTPPG